MKILSSLQKILLDSLFPITAAESAVLSLSVEESLQKLTPAPDYSGLAFDLPGTNSIYAYKDQRVSRLIWLIKEKRSYEAAKIAGYSLFTKLCEILPARDGSGPVLILPIPITAGRRRQRGYNQCELIVDEIEILQKQKIGSQHFIFRRKLLLRTDHGKEQKKKCEKSA